MYDSDPLPEFLRKPRSIPVPAWCTRERIAIVVGVAAAAMMLLTAAVVAIGARSAAAANQGPRLQIAVFEPEPVAIEAPPGKLEVLSHVEDGFQGVPERPPMPGLIDVFDQLVSYSSEPPPEPKPVEVRHAGSAPAPVVRRYAMAAPAPAPARRAPVADCRRSNSRAAAMVCAEPGLAAVDRDMRHALDRATLHGDPMRILDDQRRWLEARERAARDGPAAVEHMYRLRLAELDRY